MSLLILIFLIGSTGNSGTKPSSGCAHCDSLAVKPSAVTTSEEEPRGDMLQYTFGMDAYSSGFNKSSISTNILEERINTANGNLELKIKLLSLPMRGNKDYDLYLTYRGSPLSIPGMKVNRLDLVPIRNQLYGYNEGNGYVEDWIYDYGDTNCYLVTADMGNCGLGWNVMPGEVSLNAYWQRHSVSGGNDILCPNGDLTNRTDGFINLNGENYSIYSLEDDLDPLIWNVKGKRNWIFRCDDYPNTLYTPNYTYEVDMYSVSYPKPRFVTWDDERELFLLSKMTDHNGNYVEFEWYNYEVDDPPGARIPKRICTPTDTCYIYGDTITVDTNARLKDAGEQYGYCLWDFWVIDSIVKNVNGEKFKVNFYYHQEWFRMIREYWYGNAFVLLDSVEFLRNGNRIKPPYRFKYGTNNDWHSSEFGRPGELIELVTPDSAKYEYSYEDKISVCSDIPGEPPETHHYPNLSKYRVVNSKDVTLPDTAHIESGDFYTPDGVCEYEYTFGNPVGPSSGMWWTYTPDEGATEITVFQIHSYFPMYDFCRIDMPDTGSITYFNVDSTYVDNLLKVNYRDFEDNCTENSTAILPFEREEFYGRPYKIVTSNSRNLGANYRLKAEHFYWTISGEVLTPCGYKLRYPLHPFLIYKAVQLDPNDDNINLTEKAYVYHYQDYDQYDNQKKVSFLGEVTLTETSSYTLEFVDDEGNDQSWEISGMPEWSDPDLSDNWEVRNDYVYERDDSYAGEAFLYNLVSSKRKYKWPYGKNDIIGQVDFEYDGNPLSSATNAPMHGDPWYLSDNRGNLTKKTEWINGSDTRLQQYWYDICGNLDTLEDYMGEKYQFEYDDEYVFPYRKRYPDGSTEYFNFDKEGNFRSFTDRSGIVSEFEYDIYGRLTRYRKGIPGDLSLLKEYQYDDFERWARERSYYSINWNDATDYYYDALGRLIHLEKISPTPVVMDYIYNGNGQVFKETQPRFSDVSLYDADFTIKTLDGLSRVTGIEYPSDGEDEYVEYIYYGDTTDIIDEEECYTTLINDASGNLIQVEDALENWTNYYYDVNGNLTEIKDAEEKHTYFEYDWLGNLVKREGPDRGIDTFAYDANGNMKYHKLNSGDVIEFVYDVLGRMTQKEVNDQVEETYYYDDYDNVGGETYDPPDSLDYPEGRLTGFQNPDVKEVYFYDKFGNLGEKLVIRSTGEEDTFEYSYDLKGRVTKLKYPDGYKVEYNYDHLDNISSVEINNGETITLSSTAAGLLSGVHFPGGVTDTFAYLPRNWMELMEINGLTDTYNREFEYNNRGELNKVQERINPWSSIDIVDYQYDSLGRLKHEHRYDTDTDYEFSYDAVGNRKRVNTDDYAYYTDNDGNKTNKLKDDGPNEYNYNDIGCIKSKISDVNDTTNFYYDAEGRLVLVELPDGQNGYKYYYKGHQRIREDKITGIVHTQTQIIGSLLYSCKLRWSGISEALLEMIFLDENNDEIDTIVLENINNSGVERFSGEITNFPSGTVNAKLRARRWPGYGDGDLWVDSMSIDAVWNIRDIISSWTVDDLSDYYYDNAGNLILVSSVGSGTAANVVKNPGFETGDLTDWPENDGWSVTNQYPQEGEYSLLVLFSSASAYAYQEIPISESVSSPITISCWIRANFDVGDGGFELKGVLKGDGVNKEYSSGIITESSIGYFTQVSLTIDDIPEGTSSCEIGLIKTSGYAAVIVDNVVCELETEQEISTKYIYAGNRLLAKDDNGELFFYHLDRIGSPIMITDENGNVVKEKKYEAFGNIVWEEGIHDDNREFTSKEKDPTGFHYFGARYYSGNIGRFLTPDPHTLSPGGFKLSDPQTLNPYLYCTNDPLYYFDPDALYRVTVDNMVYRVTFGRGMAETVGSMVPAGSVLLTIRRDSPGALTTAPDDIPYPSAEIVTGVDWFWAWAAFTGVPTTVFWGTVTFFSTMNTINEGDIDKICMGMFAHAHPEAKVEGYEGYNRLNLNKVEVYKDQKNGADKAAAELYSMKKFVGEVRQGNDPKSLIQSGGGKYPDYYLDSYNAVTRQTGYYDDGIYRDEHGLFTAEY